jgi:2-dehydro-3-deoxygalactonokinase
MTALVGIDWGTTNCRAYKLDAAGGIVDQRTGTDGILNVRHGDFAGALAALAGDWIDVPAAPRVVMCGMIGSAQGWIEAPYAGLPAAIGDVASRLVAAPDPRRDIHIVPGLRGAGPAGPDVMRGEETQIFGAGLSDGVVCLPGTHSKWAMLEGGRIVRFVTFMTGEVFAVMRRNSILGRLMNEAPHDAAAFARGLVRAQAPGGLLHQLFTVRTAGLLEGLERDAGASFLSGLLIGQEIAAAKTEFAATDVTIVGANPLAQHYSIALNVAGLRTATVPGDAAAARGLFLIAREAGLAG